LDGGEKKEVAELTFLLEEISECCLSTHDDQEAALNKRMMGIVLGAFVLLQRPKRFDSTLAVHAICERR